MNSTKVPLWRLVLASTLSLAAACDGQASGVTSTEAASGASRIEGTWTCSADLDGASYTITATFEPDGTYTFFEQRKKPEAPDESHTTKGNWTLRGSVLSITINSSAAVGFTDGSTLNVPHPPYELAGAQLKGMCSLCTLKRSQ